MVMLMVLVVVVVVVVTGIIVAAKVNYSDCSGSGGSK